MKQYKSTKCYLSIDCRTTLNPTLFVGRVIYKIRQNVPVTEQTFFVLDKSVLEVSKENKNIFWEDVFKNNAIKTVETNLKGTVGIEDLKAGIYYICGVRRTHFETRVWNVRIDLKPGENCLVLDDNNGAEI